MYRLTDELIASAKNVNILDLCNEIIGGTGSQSGRYVHFICPHPGHIGKTVNNQKGKHAALNLDRNTFFCNGCTNGGGGDTIAFVQHYKGLEFAEAVKYILDFAKIPIPEDGKKEKLPIRQAMMKLAREYWEKGPDRIQYKNYWNSRGLTEYTEKIFSPGAAPGKNYLTSNLSKLGYTKDEMKQAGLLSAKGNDTYWRRLIIETNGNINARAIDKNIEPRMLVGIGGFKGFFNEKACYGKQNVIMVEAVIDATSNKELIHEAGLENNFEVSASHGTKAYNKEWFKRLKERGVRNIYFMPDMDPWRLEGRAHAAGQLAAIKMAKEAMSYGLTPFICKLEEGLDPNDFLQTIRKGINSIEDFKSILLNPMSILSFSIFVESHFHEINSLTSKIQFLDTLKKLFMDFGIPIFEEEWQQIATVTKISVEETKEYFNGFIMQQKLNNALETAKYCIKVLESNGLNRMEITRKVFS